MGKLICHNYYHTAKPVRYVLAGHIEFGEKILSIFSSEERYCNLCRSSREYFEEKLNWDVWAGRVKTIIDDYFINRESVKCKSGSNISNSTFEGIFSRKDEQTFMKKMPVLINRIYSNLKAYLDKLQNYKRLKNDFLVKMNYELNLDSPLSYNEKIQWKKIYDRNPIIAETADKFAVRSYLKKVLGEKQANDILMPLYHVTDNPEDIPFEDLPDKFVVKPNHGSQMHVLVTNKKQVSKDFLIGKCKNWLNVNFGFYSHEWAYRNIRRKIIIEKLLETTNGELPFDYKFYCFHGKCKHIRVTKNRFGRENISAFFDTDWNFISVNNSGYPKIKTPWDRPPNLSKMISLSEKLSMDFDFVRVDLFNCNGKIYFGELTHYEASGLARFEPESFDFKFGSYWNIEKKYWLKNSDLNK